MKIGVIGLGRIGRYHAGVLAAMPEVEQVLVASRSPDRAAAAAAELGVAAAPDVATLVASVDAVVVASSTDAHAGHIEAAVAAGCAVFTEKPIATDLAGTEAAIAAARAAAVPLQVGFQRRFDAGYRAARDAVAAGELGTIYAVRTASHDPAPPPERFLASSGGLFRDFMVHDFDAIRFVLGVDIVEVQAWGAVPAGMPGATEFTQAGDAACAVALLRTADGTLAVATASRHDPRGYDVRMEMFGSRDSVMVGWDEHLALRSVEPGAASPGTGWPDFLARFDAAYRAELAAFVELAAGRGENPCPPGEARAALEVAVACDMSRAERRPVRVEEAG